MHDFLTPVEYAERYFIARQTVVTWCKSGLLPGAYRVGKRWRIPPDTRPPEITPQRKAKMKEAPTQLQPC